MSQLRLEIEAQTRDALVGMGYKPVEARAAVEQANPRGFRRRSWGDVEEVPKPRGERSAARPERLPGYSVLMKQVFSCLGQSP